MIGRLHGIVIDCPDPDALATFYQSALVASSLLAAERVINC